MRNNSSYIFLFFLLFARNKKKSHFSSDILPCWMWLNDLFVIHVPCISDFPLPPVALTSQNCSTLTRMIYKSDRKPLLKVSRGLSRVIISSFLSFMTKIWKTFKLNAPRSINNLISTFYYEKIARTGFTTKLVLELLGKYMRNNLWWWHACLQYKMTDKCSRTTKV